MKKSTVYRSMLATFLVVTGIFLALFYLNNSSVFVPIQGIFNDKAQPPFSHMIYGGFGEDSLNKPMDAAIINQLVYVSDTNNKRIQVFDLGGTPLYKFGKEGNGPGELKFPYGIDGDSKGNVYVADLYNGSISVFDSKGKFIKYFAEKSPKEKLIDAPGALRIVNDKVYITEIQKSKVVVFDLNGKKIQEIGKAGQAPGQFRAPNALTVDREGNIYVVDSGNQRVQSFDKEGKLLNIINGTPEGKGTSAFVNPRGIGIDTRGVLYVVSNLTHLIYGFEKNDTTGKPLFTFGGNGESNTQFSLPNGLYIDENDQIYITDAGNQRVAVYR